MRVNKAKRKLMKWERYDARYKHKKGYYNGHAKAFYNIANARRWYPIGIREVYRSNWMVQ